MKSQPTPTAGKKQPVSFAEQSTRKGPMELSVNPDGQKHRESMLPQNVTPTWLVLSEPTGNPQDAAGAKFANVRMAAKSRQNELQLRTEKLFVVQQQVAEAIRGRKTAEQVQHLIEQSNIVTLLPRDIPQPRAAAADDDEPAHQPLHISYRRQGNIEMYTSDNMKEREHNRHHPLVVDALDLFWEVLPKTMFGNVNKSIYAWFTRKLYFSFTPSGTEEEFRAILEEDWKNDAVWSCSINVRMFRVAMYNLADIWCETTDPKEYHDFLVRCTSIVEAGGPYTGNTREGDSTVTNERAGTGFHHRRSTAAGNFLQDEMSVEDIARTADALDVGQIDMEHALDLIEREVFSIDHTAAYIVYNEAASYVRDEVQQLQEDVLHELQVVQEKRGEALAVIAGDGRGALEKLLVEELQQDSARRDKTQDRVTVCINNMQQQTKSFPADPVKAIKVRLSAAEYHTKAEGEILNNLRERTLDSFVVVRQFKNSVSDLIKDVLNFEISKVGDRDADLMVFLGMQLQDNVRRHATRGEIDDDRFNELMTLTKELQDQRELRLKRLRDPLGYDIFPMSTARDHEAMKFDSPKWQKALEWFARHRRARNDYLEDALRGVDELQSRLQFRGKQQIQQIHRQQMAFETQFFEVFGNDTTMPHAQKMELLKQFECEKKTSQARRNREMSDFNNISQELRDAVQNNIVLASVRLEEEARELKDWAKAKITREAFAASKRLLDVLAAEVPIGISDESVNRNRLMTELPEAVSGPTAFLTFSIAQTDQWFQQACADLTSLRLRMYHNNCDFVNRLEAEELLRQVEIGLRALSMRMDDTNRYKQAAQEAEEAQGGGNALVPTSSMQTKMETRLDMTQQVRSSAVGMQEALETFTAETERVLMYTESRNRGRLSQLQKIATESAFYMARFTELEGLRFSYFANRYTTPDAVTADEKNPTKAGLDPAFIERRRREDERLQQLREKKAADERALEVRRMERLLDAEKDMAKIMQNKDQRSRDQTELRKRQLKEREQAMQEKTQHQLQERKMWSDEIQAERKRLAEERQRTPVPGGGELTAPRMSVAPASGTMLRRKSKAYTPATDNTAERAKQCKKSAGATGRVSAAIAQEMDLFKQLNSQSLAINLNDFEGRRVEYLLEGSSSFSIYQSECKRLDLQPRASVETQLPKVPFAFNIPFLDFSNFSGLELLPILDVIRMNPIQKIALKATGLDKDAVRKLCQTILTHPFVHVLDVSGNKEIGTHGGQALLTLVKSNRLISTVVCGGCDIPEADMRAIEEECAKNVFVRGFSRADFELLQSVFTAIDVDRSGIVTPAELEAYIAAQSPARARKGKPSQADSIEVRKHRILDVLFEVKRQQRQGFVLAEFLSFVFPTLSPADCVSLVKKYSDESAAAPFDELQDFMATYGVSGKITLEQLANGIEVDPEELRAAFQECDLDNDGLLDTQEFLTFISG